MRAKIPRIVQALYPKRIWKGPSEGKLLYLTFDDGPIPELTPWVLDLLSTYRAKATFFCIGDNVSKNPGLYQQLLAAGHSIGNHTYNHLNGWETGTEVYVSNTLKAGDVMSGSSSSAEVPDRLFRPPYGRIKGRQARKLEKRGYRIVMWDVLSMDYDSSISAEKCFRNVVQNASEGSIVVFHDSLKAEKNLRAVLPRVLEHYRHLGYDFRGL